ncbi:hypothetical protein NAT51_18110 [Flavobacterium amniphilum]|uniref:hypothetical protein n=1 Tax=Flavobacterium amniphilum TaxID=1834035 RepID=UPI00202A7FFD|nr:hypothetical protein [Flavobacterium amniphilum]MCL9807447.1 hypothetical protein [Flavobacterium amniphilum]
MKQKKLVFTTLFVFIMLNTQYFWESTVGVSAFVVELFLLFVFLILGILLIRQIILAIMEKGSDLKRIISIVICSMLFTLFFLYPRGIINFRKFASKDLLVAMNEGAGNCAVILKLKENNEFVERTVCFGVNEIKGGYILRNDTIVFENTDSNDYYQFALIKNSELLLYNNSKDTIPHSITITKNELTK